MPMAVTRAAQVVGLLGGVAWVAAWFLWDGGDDPVELGLFWRGRSWSPVPPRARHPAGQARTARAAAVRGVRPAVAVLDGGRVRRHLGLRRRCRVGAGRRGAWSRSLRACVPRCASGPTPAPLRRRLADPPQARRKALGGNQSSELGGWALWRSPPTGRHARGSTRSCGDDQPAHLPARPARHRRRRRHERLRDGAVQAARRAGHRGRHLHPGHLLGAARRSSRPRRECWSDNIHAGPFEGLTKAELPGQMCVFAREVLRTEASQPLGHYSALHSHYWLSGQVGALARDRWGVPLVHSMHTMAKVKNDALAEGDTPEPAARIIGEEQVVEAADMLIANTDTEAKQLINLYDACASRVEVIHPGVDLEVFRPRDRAETRRRLDLPADASVLLFAGRIQPLKAPDVLLRAVAVLLERDPDLRSRLVVPDRRRPVGLGPRPPRVAGPAGLGARPRRRRAVRAAGGAGRAGAVVRRGRPGRRTVLQRVVRPGRRRGPGLRHPGRGGRRRRPDDRRRRRPQRRCWSTPTGPPTGPTRWPRWSTTRRCASGWPRRGRARPRSSRGTSPPRRPSRPTTGPGRYMREAVA